MYLTYTSRMMACRRDGYEEGLHTGLTTGHEEGISIGLEQGLERGAYENKLETVRTTIISHERIYLWCRFYLGHPVDLEKYDCR